MIEKENILWLKIAHRVAKGISGCTKVQVGSIVVSSTGEVLGSGANVTHPNLCKSKGCLREEKYGNNSKLHRNPDDCRALHSEIDAIGDAASSGKNTSGATIYVTRYPCEGCARAIVAAGIATVVYGRDQEITQMTREILAVGNVEIIWVKEFQEEDVLT